MFNLFKKKSINDFGIPDDFDSQYQLAQVIICNYFEVILRLGLREAGENDIDAEKSEKKITNHVVEAYRLITGEADTRDKSKISDDDFIESLEAIQNSEIIVENAMKDNEFCEFIIYTLKQRDKSQAEKIGKEFLNSNEAISHKNIYLKYEKNILNKSTSLSYKDLLTKFYIFRLKAKEQGLLVQR